MAQLNCLKNHAPKDQNLKTYAHPLAYETHNCNNPTCKEDAVIWLNPAEAAAFERGTREFWDDQLNSFNVQDAPLESYQPSLIQVLKSLLATLKKDHKLEPRTQRPSFHQQRLAE